MLPKTPGSGELRRSSGDLNPILVEQVAKVVGLDLAHGMCERKGSAVAVHPGLATQARHQYNLPCGSLRWFGTQ